jgi:hypothetical protein
VTVFSFRVECSIKCPRCDRPVFLNGPVTATRCRSCQSDIAIPPDYWEGILGDGIPEMRDSETGTGSGSTIFGTFSTSLTLARFDPYCDSCKTDFADPWSLSPGTEYECSECGEVYPVDPPPAWMAEKLGSVAMLINAEADGEGEGEEGGDGTGSEPVALACPQCGGWLAVDGSDRLVRCQYCDVQVYLPDDLWLRLHPVRKKRRWFVVCR